jgi:hypothetical protein
MRRARSRQTNKINTGGLQVQNDKTPEWVRAMHAHFNLTGTYRASDIQRVLGDPRKSVEGPVTAELAAAASRPRRGE